MNVKERIKMVKSMEFICRQINSEYIYDCWLCNGVADGDIPYGDFSINTDDDLEFYYADDTDFADLMDTFLTLMVMARKDGGLYCDGVTDEARKWGSE